MLNSVFGALYLKKIPALVFQKELIEVPYTKSKDQKEETFATFWKNTISHRSTFCKYNDQGPSGIFDGILKRVKVISNAVHCACQLVKIQLSEHVNILVGIHFGRENKKLGEILNK
jgi:hypothetical protein